ncbi:hypothetical protein FA13DRAFT_620319 [Coprinellus micaceus]|uniref:MYND-type domain-containing protein n=1 Tax=Coprinellus micaceus TaxID=71717 RepID=A0A4Y7T7T1_COPMI|nr:hypothetical protein FA13DRAFT_620319 [Coprinellus micaceus]
MGRKRRDRARAPTAPTSSNQPQASAESHLCEVCCEEVAKYTCTDCKTKRYCGRECQERSWETHIFDCVTHEPIKSYHHLARAIREDLIPTNQSTLQEWGFDRAQYSAGPINGLSCLLGVYGDMIKAGGHRAKALDQWRRKGSLFTEIKKTYEAIPEGYRGGYYQWLLQNEHVFNNSQPTPNSAGVIANSIAQAGWAYATNDTRARSLAHIRQETEKWSSLRRNCFLLCGMTLNQIRPHPVQDEWVLFGFCVGDQYTELRTGGYTAPSFPEPHSMSSMRPPRTPASSN